MRVARRTLLGSALAAVAAPAVLRFARAAAAPVTLKLHHFFSSVTAVHERFLVPWARKVEADAAGRIRIDIFPSMQLGGGPAQLFDQVCDGYVDIVWAVPSHVPDRIPKIEAFELPFIPARRALVNSRALQDYATANLIDEFREAHPLAFSCRDHGAVHAKHAVQSIADIRRLRLHVPNRLAAETAHALGAHGVSMPNPQIPMAIAARVIDGCIDPWDILPGLRLFDALKAHTDFAEGSLATTTFVLAMNRSAYERLPRDLKAVVDANSGQMAAGMAGAMWDADAAAVAATVRGRGDAIDTLSGEEAAPWRKLTEPVTAAWLKRMKERRIDGSKLLASAQTLVEKHAGEPEPAAASAATPQSPAQVKAEAPAPVK
jgi:TRAP-type transport system periplasmic protein